MSQKPLPARFIVTFHWDPCDAAPLHGLHGWIASLFRPAKLDLEAAVPSQAWRGGPHPLLTRLSVGDDPALDGGSRNFARVIGAAVVRGLAHPCRPAELGWVRDLDGQDAARGQLSVDERGQTFTISLHPALLRWSWLAADLRDWAASLAQLWPPSRVVSCEGGEAALGLRDPRDEAAHSRMLRFVGALVEGGRCFRPWSRPGGLASLQRSVWAGAVLRAVLLGDPYALGLGEEASPAARGEAAVVLRELALKERHPAASPGALPALPERVADRRCRLALWSEAPVELFLRLREALFGEGQPPPVRRQVAWHPVQQLALAQVIAAAERRERLVTAQGGLSVHLAGATVAVEGNAAELIALATERLAALPVRAGVLRVAGAVSLARLARVHPDGLNPILGLLLVGEGHERFLSQRLLQLGPWWVRRLNDRVTLVQLHDLDADEQTAAAQAAAGQRWLAGARLPDRAALPEAATLNYDAAARLLWLDARELPLDRELLAHLVGVARQRRAAGLAVAQVGVAFASSEQAAPHLRDLWLRELQAFVEGPEGRRTLEAEVQGAFPEPEWVRGARCARVRIPIQAAASARRAEGVLA